MKKSITALIDYKGEFGSKHSTTPYRSGMDKTLLTNYFKEKGYEIEFVYFHDVDLRDDKWVNTNIIYTSSEDIGYHYKSYIEDVIFGLEQKGAHVIPGYKYLRANNNKVFMELIRHSSGYLWKDNLKSWVFGTYEEMTREMEKFSFPIVIKTAAGAMSKGVFLAKNEEELSIRTKKISRSKDTYQDIKDFFRPIKHKGYVRESLFRNKFILQQFIPNLKNDWKILIFGKRYYVLTRHTHKNDFRASGSHYNYMAGSKAILPRGIFDFAKKIYDVLDVPHLSLDVVFDGENYHLIEFQSVYFGTSTYNMSDIYFHNKNSNWITKSNSSLLEKIYADSIVTFIDKN